MDEYTESELCYEFGHTAYQHDHANVCQATDLLWGSQDSPSMKHNDWNQVKRFYIKSLQSALLFQQTESVINLEQFST